MGFDTNAGWLVDIDDVIYFAPGGAFLDTRDRKLQRKPARWKRERGRRERVSRLLAKIHRNKTNRLKNWHHKIGGTIAAGAGQLRSTI